MSNDKYVPYQPPGASDRFEKRFVQRTGDGRTYYAEETADTGGSSYIVSGSVSVNGSVAVNDGGGSITVDQNPGYWQVTGTVGLSPSSYVGGYTACIDATIALTTGSAYASGDFVGTTSTPITFSNCARANGGTGVILGALLVDKATSGSGTASGELWLFESTVTPPADNAAWSISDADAAKCIGIVPFSTYYASALNSVCPVGNLTIVFKTDGGSKDLFGCFVTRGTPTYSTNDLLVRLRLLQD